MGNQQLLSDSPHALAEITHQHLQPLDNVQAELIAAYITGY